MSVLSLTSCVTPEPPPPLASFNEVEYSAYDNQDTGKVEGSAFARTRGGELRYAAGSEVIITPSTSHGRDWANRNYSRNRMVASLDSRAYKYTKTTYADAQGSFEFKNLPTGEYIVLTSVFWEYPRSTGTTVYMARTGGFLLGRVTVTNGETSKVVVQ